MAISLPVLSGVRRRARAAVCMSNLRQWAMVYKMYTDEFDGKLPRDYDEAPWYYPIRNYYSDKRAILLCPSAKKPSSQNGASLRSQYGDTFAAWEVLSPKQEEIAWNSIGSYGLNCWAYKPEIKNLFEDMNNPDINNEENIQSGSSGSGTENWLKYYWIQRFGGSHGKVDGDPTSRYGNIINGGDGSSDDNGNNIEDMYKVPEIEYCWLMAYENQASTIPMVFDSMWLYSIFNESASPPPSENRKYYSITNTPCIDRHDGGINFAFMDFSVRKVGLKELWTLKWHRQFNTAGPWTKAGGVQPEEWPKWMRKYKDY